MTLPDSGMKLYQKRGKKFHKAYIGQDRLETANFTDSREVSMGGEVRFVIDVDHVCVCLCLSMSVCLCVVLVLVLVGCGCPKCLEL